MKQTETNHSPPLLVEKRAYTFADPPQQLILESGAKLGPVTIAYETYGSLSPEKDNAVLIAHAFSGDSHAAGYYIDDVKRSKPGWWDSVVGPGKGIDTDHYFVICSNILGSCMGSTGPASINPETGEYYGLEFPMVTIGDMVEAQKYLIDHLGIEKLHCVIGGSVGGMQVLEWCVRFPEMVRSAIPVATTMRHSAMAIAFNEVARQAIMADPNWNNGDYYSSTNRPDMGLAVARMVGHVTYLSDEAMRRKFGRRLQDKNDFSYDFDVDFEVESYLRYQGSKFVERFDANSLLYITKAADYFDLTQPKNGGPGRDFTMSRAKFLVISYSSDWLYPTYQSKELVQALKRSGKDVSFCEIEADAGHDAFLIPDTRLRNILRGFLDGVE